MNARSELANGIDWSELWQIIKEAKRNGDPTANIIHSLKLENNEIVLLLADNTDEDVSNPPMKVHSHVSKFSMKLILLLGGGRYQSVGVWECREILSDEEENRDETPKDRRDGRKRLEGRRTKGARKSEGREGEGRHQADPQDLLVREILLVHNFRKLFGVVRS